MRILILASALAVLSTPASACGGNGEPPCTTAPATYQRTIACDGGSFRDPRNNGECWSCDGWSRTANAVTSGAACSVAGYTSTRSASRVKNTAWAWDCKGGTFWDGWDGGACWSCSGWDRTANHINSGSACSHAYPEQVKAARYVKANYCQAGEFSDPRNGGECWTCPSGYDRTASAVTAGDACVARSRCAAGSIEYAGACWTKGACGANGGRPCTLGERIPSCNDGLKESAGRCIPLAPGESPFLAGLGEAMKNVSKDGMKACDDFFSKIPKLNTGNPFLDAEGTCSKAQMTGFLCAATELPGQIGGATDLIAKISMEYGRDPCKTLGAAIPHRALCSTALAMGRDMVDAFQCMADATKGTSFAAVPLETLCRLEGELGFELALMAAGGAVAAEGEAAGAAAGEAGQAAEQSGVMMKVARALLKANDAVGKANDANEFADKMKEIASCRRMAGLSSDGQKKAEGARLDGLPRQNVPGSANKGDLLFYRVSAAGELTLTGKRVGNGWGGFQNIVPAGDAVYAVNDAGDLLKYPHDGNGAFIGNVTKVGSGWGGGQSVLSLGDGSLALRKPDGSLWIYGFDAAGTNVSSSRIGDGWNGYAKVLYGGANTFYGIDSSGVLYRWSRNGPGGTWNIMGQRIGQGWLADPVVFSTGGGDLYAVDATGALFRYHHRDDGAFVVERQRVADGFKAFGTRLYGVPDGSGEIYGIVQ